MIFLAQKSCLDFHLSYLSWPYLEAVMAKVVKKMNRPMPVKNGRLLSKRFVLILRERGIPLAYLPVSGM